MTTKPRSVWSMVALRILAWVVVVDIAVGIVVYVVLVWLWWPAE